jgi:hypothetical protein
MMETIPDVQGPVAPGPSPGPGPESQFGTPNTGKTAQAPFGTPGPGPATVAPGERGTFGPDPNSLGPSPGLGPGPAPSQLGPSPFGPPSNQFGPQNVPGPPAGPPAVPSIPGPTDLGRGPVAPGLIDMLTGLLSPGRAQAQPGPLTMPGPFTNAREAGQTSTQGKDQTAQEALDKGFAPFGRGEPSVDRGSKGDLGKGPQAGPSFTETFGRDFAPGPTPNTIVGRGFDDLAGRPAGPNPNFDIAFDKDVFARTMDPLGRDTLTPTDRPHSRSQRQERSGRTTDG